MVEVFLSIDPNMGGKPISQVPGKVIDERDISEMVSSTQEDPVGFKGIASIRQE